MFSATASDVQRGPSAHTVVASICLGMSAVAINPGLHRRLEL